MPIKRADIGGSVIRPLTTQALPSTGQGEALQGLSDFFYKMAHSMQDELDADAAVLAEQEAKRVVSETGDFEPSKLSGKFWRIYNKAGIMAHSQAVEADINANLSRLAAANPYDAKAFSKAVSEYKETALKDVSPEVRAFAMNDIKAKEGQLVAGIHKSTISRDMKRNAAMIDLQLDQMARDALNLAREGDIEAATVSAQKFILHSQNQVANGIGYDAIKKKMTDLEKGINAEYAKGNAEREIAAGRGYEWMRDFAAGKHGEFEPTEKDEIMRWAEARQSHVNSERTRITAEEQRATDKMHDANDVELTMLFSDSSKSWSEKTSRYYELAKKGKLSPEAVRRFDKVITDGGVDDSTTLVMLEKGLNDRLLERSDVEAAHYRGQITIATRRKFMDDIANQSKSDHPINTVDGKTQMDYMLGTILGQDPASRMFSFTSAGPDERRAVEAKREYIKLIGDGVDPKRAADAMIMKWAPDKAAMDNQQKAQYTQAAQPLMNEYLDGGMSQATFRDRLNALRKQHAIDSKTNQTTSSAIQALEASKKAAGQ